MVAVAGAQDDGIDMRGRAVLEGCGIAVDLFQQRHFFPVRRPVKAHGSRAVRNGDRLAAVFPALRSDVFGGIGGADDQDVLARELARIAEIMRMQNAPVEGVEARKFRHVRGAEVAGCHHDMVEFFGIGVIVLQVVDGDGELARRRIMGNMPDRRAEPDPGAHPGAVHPAFDIVEQHRARRVAGDLFAEMFLKGVIGKFQPFLRAVRPQIAVHGAVDRLAIFVQPGPPGVIPQPAPVVLLFEADDLGDLGALLRRRLERPQLCQSRRSRPDHRYPFRHHILSVLAQPTGRIFGKTLPRNSTDCQIFFLL